jgi:hypothetical protein
LKRGKNVIDLFNHTITGTSYLLLYMAVIASVAACYWLSIKLNEYSRKAAGSATSRRARSRQQRRPASRSVPAVNTVVHGRERIAPVRLRTRWAVELDKRMSPLYVFNPATCSVSRRTFASAQDTREAWVEKYELRNRSDRGVVLRFTPRRKPGEDKGAAKNAQAS